MKISKKKLDCIIICIMMLVAWNILMNMVTYNMIILRLMVGVSLTLFSVCLFILKMMYTSMNNLFVLYYIIYYIYSFGQYILIMVGVSYSSFAGIRWDTIPEQYIFEGLSFCTSAQIALTIGALLVYKNNKGTLISDYNNEAYLIKIKKIGLILMCISIPFDLTFQIRRTIQYMMFGYTSSFGEVNSIFGSLTLFCIPGCYMVALGNKNCGWFKRNAPLLYIIIRSVLMLLAGSRGQSIGALMALVWYYLKINSNKKESRKIFWKKVIRYGVMVYAGLATISSIRKIRNQAGRGLSMMLASLLQTAIGGDVLKDVLRELGGSIKPLIFNMQYIDGGQLHYVYGGSFLAPLIMIVPNFLRFGLYEEFCAMGWLGIENKLSEMANLGYGIGYSMNAELYYNFGHIGWIFGIILGMIFAKTLSTDFRIKKEKDVIWFALKPAMFTLIIMTTRGSFQLFYNYLVWYMLFPYILV